MREVGFKLFASKLVFRLLSSVSKHAREKLYSTFSMLKERSWLDSLERSWFYHFPLFSVMLSEIETVLNT
jgi:hypothetical protein